MTHFHFVWLPAYYHILFQNSAGEKAGLWSKLRAEEVGRYVMVEAVKTVMIPVQKRALLSHCVIFSLLVYGRIGGGPPQPSSRLPLPLLLLFGREGNRWDRAATFTITSLLK